MIISSKNTLTDMPQNNVLPALCISFSSLKLTYKISPATAFNYFPSPTEQSLFSLTLMYTAFRTFDHGLILYCHLIPLSIWILQFKHWKLYCSCSEHWEIMHYAFSSFANAVFFLSLSPFFPPHFFMKDKFCLPSEMKFIVHVTPLSEPSMTHPPQGIVSVVTETHSSMSTFF